MSSADQRDASRVMQQAILAYQGKHWPQAEQLCAHILQSQPDCFDALNLSGIIALRQQRLQNAVELLSRAVSVDPSRMDALSNLGAALQDLGRHDEALACYDRALKINPQNAAVLNNRGITLSVLGRGEAALQSYGLALDADPEHVEAMYNRGNVLCDLKRPEAALESYARALQIKPDYAEALNSRGSALRDLRRLQAALESYDQALKLRPGYTEALHNRGNVLCDLNRYDAALESYDDALKINPRDARTLTNRASALCHFRRYAEALQSCDRALHINRGLAQAWCTRSAILRDLGRPAEALQSSDGALGIEPRYADALINRGNALRDLQRHDEALQSYALALECNPDAEFLPGIYLHAKMTVCDWSGLHNALSSLLAKVELDEKVSPSFPLLALSGSLRLQQKSAACWVRSRCPPSAQWPALAKHPRHGKIRIGYFSADFHNHATAYLMAGLIESHDRSRFEVLAFSFGPDKHDETRSRLVAAFDRFTDLGNRSDSDVASLARTLELDIAIDLKGFTQNSRPGIFALRAAPIQVNYLGYPGTMGADYMDYLIADATLVPARERVHYTEKIVYLPHSYQINDSKRCISERKISRAASGLPDTGFVFCCFNKSYKIVPATFDGWMRILRQVEGSVLWLFEDHPLATRNLQQEAQKRGVAPERLVFATGMPLAQHLARHRAADLFLDTLPYNAHTTASDALWAGLPVLTCLGAAFAGRVAASLLNAIGLPELVTSTQTDYEALAVALAAQPEKLAQIKQKLERQRLTHPLFDTALFTKHIEAAYLQMYGRYQADLPPDHIQVLP